MPETKGKTLEEMEQVFGSHASTEDMAEFAITQERVGLTALVRGRNPDQASSMNKEKVEVHHISDISNV